MAESAVDCHKPGETYSQGISQYQMVKVLGAGASGVVHLVVYCASHQKSPTNRRKTNTKIKHKHMYA
jgi:hypothetical protein